MDQSGTRESSFPAFQSRQALMVFRDILDTVLHLSDEEWKTLTEDMTHQYTKQKFASLCTEIVMSMSESVIGKMMPDLIERYGIESVLRAKAKLKEKDECESRSRSATPSCSGQSLPEDSSDLVQNSIQTAITKIKAAMQEAIRRVASGKKLKTVANKIIKSLKKISRKSHVKLESGDSVQLKNKATRDASDLLVKHFSRVLTSLDPSVETTSDAKEIIEIVVNSLVSAAEEKDDDRVIPIYIAKNGRVREARKNARALANLIAEPFFKSNRAGSFVRTCSSDSLFETAGTEVNTVNSIPCHSETIYTFAEESTKCVPLFIGSPVKPDFSAESKKGDDAAVIPISVMDDDHVHQITDENKLLFKKGKDTVLESNMCLSKCVLKQGSKRPPLPWSNEGASCTNPEVISDAGAEHEPEKNILDRPAEKDTVRVQADSLRKTAGTISHGGSADPALVSVEEVERPWFDIIPEKNPPINCYGFKKENNGRADILKVSEQPTSSTEEDLPMTSHGK